MNIYVIGNAPNSQLYQEGNLEHFKRWVNTLNSFELDIETNVSPYWCDKTLITVQIGWKDTGYLFQWSTLTKEEKQEIKQVLEDPTKKKYIHNAQFEYIVLRFHGIEISNVFDTMVAEMLLNSGIENIQYNLSACTQKYLGIELDKTEQTTFGDDVLTENKVIYAMTDVMHLHKIADFQTTLIKKIDSEAVCELEMKAVLCLGEMTYRGFRLDVEEWDKNEELAIPLVNSSRDSMEYYVKSNPKLRQKAIELGFLSEEDKPLYSFKSPKIMLELLHIMFPDIDGSSRAVIKKYLRNTGSSLSSDKLGILLELQDGVYDMFEAALFKHHKEVLMEKKLIRPKGTLDINWDSKQQVLNLVQSIAPKLTSLAKEVVEEQTDKFFGYYREYTDNTKLISSFGHKFIEKYLEPDGKIRSSYNQIVSTGRLSSRNPNLQQIPSKESVGMRYRNPFKSSTDNFTLVDSDYSSAELCIMAFISKDPVWLEALSRNSDLHSRCSELLFNVKWEEATEEGCDYYKRGNDGEYLRKKCNCKGHKHLRTATKTLDFGLKVRMIRLAEM